MGRWQEKILKPAETLLTKPTEPPFVSSVSGYSEHFQKIIAVSIDRLPTTIGEVLGSPLFCADDQVDIETGIFTQKQLRLYIGSWLVNGKQFPTPIYPDFEDRLVIARSKPTLS
mgnify:CR=1 FL=1